MLGAGSVLNKAHTEEYAVYAGSPAVQVKKLDPEAAYFRRERGFVH
jgi:acetyltransferase-like isoleucine patch superfamily enzyme